MPTRRQFLTVASAALGLGAGLGLYTGEVEPHWVDWVRRPLPIRGLPSGLVGKRLVQLSDIHVGLRVMDAYVTQVFAQVRDLAPDIVAYTGDYITLHPAIFEQVDRVYARAPRGRVATVGILGNHDYGHRWRDRAIADEMTQRLSRVGVTVLRNQAVDVAGLTIAGVDDFWGPNFGLRLTLDQIAEGRPALVLSHNPDSAMETGWAGYEGWILSGHTHGGQCKPPFLPPPLLPVVHRQFTAGEFGLAGGRRMYINRGLGHSLQVRFNVRPEVTVFTLTEA